MRIKLSRHACQTKSEYGRQRTIIRATVYHTRTRTNWLDMQYERSVEARCNRYNLEGVSNVE